MPLAALLIPFLAQGTSVYRLHKFMQPIGEERTVRSHDDAGDEADATEFGFTDRGSPVRLHCDLRLTAKGDPISLSIKGRTSRGTTIDRSVLISGNRAKTIENLESGETKFEGPAFPSPGYAPLNVQGAMLRYWRAHGRPAAMACLPSGTLRIAERGSDTIQGKRLHRYLVQGVVWGRETLWADDAGALVAAVTCDAEFDHFEGIAEGWEDALPTFVGKAAGGASADLARSVQTPKAPRRLALVGGRLIDGTGAGPVENATVLVEDGKIRALGKELAVPKGYETIDVRGKTVMPGLWDMHAHYEQAEWGPIYLASGVTTVRDCGNEFEFITAARDANDRGGMGPRLLLAGLVDGTSTMFLGTARVDTEAQVKAAVARYRAAGFRQIKIYSSVKPEMVPVVVREAHAAGMTVTGHIPDGMTLEEGITAGMDMVSHIDYVVKQVQGKGRHFVKVDVYSPEARAVVAFMKAHGTVLDDTLTIYEMSIHRPIKNAEEIEPGLAFVAPELATALRSGFGMGFPPGGPLIDSWASLVVALQQAGVPVVAGTDQTVPGFSLPHELEIYVRAGMAPMDAIRAACAVPAKAMGLDAEVGTLTPGKRADVLVVDGDPLANISEVRKVWLTLAKGRPYRPAPLWRAVGFTPPNP